MSTANAGEIRVGEVVLSVRDVSLRLGGTPVLEKVSFDIRDRIRVGFPTGQIVALLGPSGVGKTSLLRVLAGLAAPDAGEVLGIGGKRLVAGEVGLVFQSYPLLAHRTALGNLEVAARIAGLGVRAARERAMELLASFRLADHARHYPAQLSGGQRQRVAIAQQLIHEKKLLLMDEPFSGLDPAALDEVMHMVVEVANRDDLNTILIVTHDIHSAMVVSDTAIMLGRDRLPDGSAAPGGAHVQATYNLVERGLAYHPELTGKTEFVALELEMRERFKRL